MPERGQTRGGGRHSHGHRGQGARLRTWVQVDVNSTVREVMSGSWRASFSARKRDYLGASNTISTRETTATRSTLRGEEKRPVSSVTTTAPGKL